jgi:hypothetical protein
MLFLFHAGQSSFKVRSIHEAQARTEESFFGVVLRAAGRFQAAGKLLLPNLFPSI